MRRPLTTLAAATTAVILSAGPAFAHDKAAGPSPEPKPAKARLELSCTPAGDQAVAIRCTWSGAAGAARYVVYRDTRGAKRSTVVVKTGERVLEDTAVVAGAAYGYRVKAIDAQGRRIGASRTVKVRCCGADQSKPATDVKEAGAAGKPAAAKPAKADRPRAEGR